MTAAQTLKDAGITPFAGEYYISWFGRHFWSDFYSADYELLTGCDGTQGQSPQDEAAAIKAGILSTEDPRFLGWLPMWKAFTDLGSQEYVAQEPMLRLRTSSPTSPPARPPSSTAVHGFPATCRPWASNSNSMRSASRC